MKIILCLLLITSCAIPVTRHRVIIERPRVKIIKTRAEKYIKCITTLSMLGIRQTLIQDLCNASFGAIDK